MEQIEVSIGKHGHILIGQDDPQSDAGVVVVVHPSQTDLLIQWITEAKAEIEAQPPGTFPIAEPDPAAVPK
jgi:hypothetical protein